MLWHHGGEEHTEAQFLATKAWRDTVEINDEYVAQIHSIQHIEFRSFEKGYLQNIYVKEGQMVKKGQELFQIMPMLMEAEFEKAKAEYELAKIEYDNTNNLEKRKVVSVNELALAKARLDKAAAEMKLAETHLSMTTIRTPFDGIIDRFHVRLGSLVEEGELLTTLSDNSNMWVYFNVSEANYLNFKAAHQDNLSIPVALVLANGTRFDQMGTLDTIEADFNNETGNVAFRATFPNPNGLLRHGETGTVLMSRKLENRVVIPQKATFEVLDKKFVYVVDDTNHIHAREISVAEEVPHLFVVAEGIEEGDTILLEGLGKVHDGQEIAVKPQTTEEVQASLHLAVE
ncbi:MAG: efflux RND transporter periplasmic adaptor subunit [Proteobacteria bacterium]|nr:efflux RND transporter periplasmic adaptor subunit [Pseudomonadota bacterium]